MRAGTDAGVRMLVLFDCDGTLFLGEDRPTQPAMLAELPVCRLGASAAGGFDHEAGCSRPIAQEVIRNRALGDVDFDDRAQARERLSHHRLDEISPREWRTPAGTHEALAELRRLRFDLAVMTGIAREIARTRLERAGIAQFFPDGQGAFGSEVCDHDDLLELALTRAACGAADAVAVGSTSCDVLAAIGNGIEMIAVDFEYEPPRKAEHAQAVVDCMPCLVRTLQRLRDRRLARA